MTGKGLIHLKTITELRSLHLERTRVDDLGIRHRQTLDDLVYLNLYGTRITDQSLNSLAGPKNLRRLYVWQTAATRGGTARLKNRLPQLKTTMGFDLSQLSATSHPEIRSRPTGEFMWMVLNPNQAPPNSKTGSSTRVVFQNRMKTSVKLIWISCSCKKSCMVC